MKFPDVMLDLETLGTSADSVILSIGAVRFDSESHEIDDNGFYASVSIDSNLEQGRRIAEDTLIWWLQQSPEAQAVFHEPKDMLDVALENFIDWFVEGGDPSNTRVWSNGADFDIPMVAHAIKRAGQDVPWQFWNTRCFRTLKNMQAAKNVTVPRAGVHHNALHDALYQAKVVQYILNGAPAQKAVA